MPSLEIFQVLEPYNTYSYPVFFREIMPVLRPRHQPSQQLQKREGEEWQGQCRQLKELFLENVRIETTEEAHHVAACLGQYERWNNLRVLEVGFSRLDGPVCLDPIFRAICFGNSDGEVMEHMPCLEEFRLASASGSCYKLDDDEALARLLRKPSIKHLSFEGLIQPRHCHLMQSHLSQHRNIEKIGIWNIDSKGREWVPYEDQDEENDRRQQDVARAARCLLQLARDNPNVKELLVLDIGDDSYVPRGALVDELDEWLRPVRRELRIWTALNRNGRKHFRDCTNKSPFRWTRRECVYFLLRLSRIDNDYTDSMAVEALFLSLRMRPDLCLRSERGDVRKST